MRRVIGFRLFLLAFVVFLVAVIYGATHADTYTIVIGSVLALAALLAAGVTYRRDKGPS